MANQYIYTANEKLGMVMMVEGENGTTDMHRIKVEEESFHTLHIPWWDKDNINRLVTKNEKAIVADQRYFILNGVHGMIDKIVSEINKLEKIQRAAVISELNDKLNS